MQTPNATPVPRGSVPRAARNQRRVQRRNDLPSANTLPPLKTIKPIKTFSNLPNRSRFRQKAVDSAPTTPFTLASMQTPNATPVQRGSVPRAARNQRRIQRRIDLPSAITLPPLKTIKPQRTAESNQANTLASRGEAHLISYSRDHFTPISACLPRKTPPLVLTSNSEIPNFRRL